MPRSRKEGKQAVVVIHGVGNQRPGHTVRSFIQAITRGTVRSKPDRFSQSYELRRFSLVRSRTIPDTDLYELYWAHHLERPGWGTTLRWAGRLLCRRLGSVPAALRPVFGAIWAVLLLTVLSLAAFLVWRLRASGPAEVFSSVTTYLPIVLVVLELVAGKVVLDYVGDAARYLTDEPENIASRSNIRAAGVGLLRRLHEAGIYSRIVVVGHSLGSVIGYDVLRFSWDALRHPSRPGPQPEMEGFQAAVEALRDADGGASRGRRIEEFQQYQHRLWRENRVRGVPWLVTDFVTLGSPLAHVRLLLDHRRVTVEQRIAERELPTCPPVADEADGGVYYGSDRDVVREGVRGKFHFRELHHGAVFATTRWTNLFFPHRRLVLGDVIGGPVGEVFGEGVRDVELRPSLGGAVARTLCCHVQYFLGADEADAVERDQRRAGDLATRTKLSIIALRSALRLDARRAKEAWPPPDPPAGGGAEEGAQGGA